MENEQSETGPISGRGRDPAIEPLFRNPVDADFWAGRSVFVTGHTGFMGSWLVSFLKLLGAQVSGYSLGPPTKPSMYEVAGIRNALKGEILADIRDGGKLVAALRAAEPQIVFHLAAQPIVRYAHAHPVETLEVNVIGTSNLLEAIRNSPKTRAVIVVTSDKVYRNMEWDWEYREADQLGGAEPYGVSKACAELIIEAYRASFLERVGIGVATVRAGNIIGGGDWAMDRLIPDAVRAFSAGDSLLVRSPNSYRPWQHVLESIHGQIILAERLFSDPVKYSQAWNFGPLQDDHRPVSFIVDHCARLWGAGAAWHIDRREQPYEAKRLAVNSARAIARLGWRPVWRLEQSLVRTIDWYSCYANGADLWAKTLDDISAFAAAARESGEYGSDCQMRIEAGD